MSSDIEDAHESLMQDIWKINSSENTKRSERRTTVRAIRDSLPPVNLEPVLKEIGGDNLKGKLNPLAEPLDKPKAKRIQRAAGYENVTVDVNRWDGLVNQRRIADQLTFPLERVDCRLVTTEKNFKPSLKTDLEKEVYGLLQGAKLLNEKQETEEEKNIKKAMSLKEIREKSRMCAKDRALKHRLEKKASLLNKSKSRKYHKIVRREKLKMRKREFETLKSVDPEAALDILNEIEKIRLRERMNLRHKNSKWLRLQRQKSGKDGMVRDLLKENSDMRKELLEKMQTNQKESEEAEDDADDLILKYQDDAIKSGKFDSGNAWVSQLAVPSKETKPEDSFIKMKKYWEGVKEAKMKEMGMLKEVNQNEEEEEMVEDDGKEITVEKENNDVNIKEMEMFWKMNNNEEEGNNQESKKEEGNILNIRKKKKLRKQMMEKKKEREENDGDINNEKSVDDSVAKKGNVEALGDVMEDEAEENSQNVKKVKASIMKKSKLEIKKKARLEMMKKAKLEMKKANLVKKKKNKAETVEDEEPGDVSVNKKSKLEMKKKARLEMMKKAKLEMKKANLVKKNKAETVEDKEPIDVSGNKKSKLEIKKKARLEMMKKAKLEMKKANLVKKNKAETVEDEEPIDVSGNKKSKLEMKKKARLEMMKKAKLELKKAKLEKEKKSKVETEENDVEPVDVSVNKKKNTKKSELIKNKKIKSIENKNKINKANKSIKEMNEETLDDKEETEGQNKEKVNTPKTKKAKILEKKKKNVKNDNVNKEKDISIDEMFKKLVKKTVNEKKVVKKTVNEKKVVKKIVNEKKTVNEKKAKKSKLKTEKTPNSTSTSNKKSKSDSTSGTSGCENNKVKKQTNTSGIKNKKPDVRTDASEAKQECNNTNTNKIMKNSSASEDVKKDSEVPSNLSKITARRLGTTRPDYAFLKRKIENESDDEDSDDEGFDDVFDDVENLKLFEEEKKAQEEQNKVKNADNFLEGWGSWGGPGIVPSAEKRKRFTIEAPKSQPHKYSKVGNVIYNEKNDVHDNLRKLMVTDLPYPFTTVKDFEASIRQPISSTFLPVTAHKKLIAPAVVHKMGKMIYPMTEESLVKDHDYKKNKVSKLEEKLNKKLSFEKKFNSMIQSKDKPKSKPRFRSKTINVNKSKGSKPLIV